MSKEDEAAKVAMKSIATMYLTLVEQGVPEQRAVEIVVAIVTGNYQKTAQAGDLSALFAATRAKS